MYRIVVSLDAINKTEAIVALEMLLNIVKSSEYESNVSESVIVTNEGTV